ncbi:hypothetical protein [Deinococcus fonticola]|uniref:hypothetical protein n=1 Tax=Deinococcus fonticola TaxID=2528713 RepID=UPI001074D0EA|nr:hypothetical protein [Deinococcus fonticola]
MSWIETRLCQAGRLTLEVQGREAGDEKPRLHVFLNSREIARIDAAVQRQTLELALPEAGLLRLAYLNDYYRSEVRSAVLEEIRLVGAPCTGVKAVQLPPNTGERWAAATVFTSHATLTVQPCSAGQLQFKAVGRSGAGRFPVLTIEQGGRLIKTLHAGAMRQLVRVPVGEQPLSITLTNPYFKELADRNLFIRRWRFQPVATSP